MLLHFFSESLILMDWLLEIIFKDFKALRNFCKSVDINIVEKYQPYPHSWPPLCEGFSLSVALFGAAVDL